MSESSVRTIFTSLFLFVLFLGYSQEQIQGEVTLADGSPVAGAQIYLDGNNVPITTDANGLFSISSSTDFDKISLVKRGYELAGSIVRDNKLSLTVRRATIKRVNGQLRSTWNVPTPNKEIYLTTASGELSISNSQGEFSFRIPYEEQIDIASAVSLGGSAFQVENLNIDEDRGQISFRLIAVVDEQEYQIRILTPAGPLANFLVFIGTQSYVTDNEGAIYTSAETAQGMNEENVNVDGYAVGAISTSGGDKKYEVRLDQQSRPVAAPIPADAVMQDTLSLEPQLDSTFTSDELSGSIDSLVEYYTAQQVQLEEQNRKIQRITDSLSFMPDLSQAEQEKLLDQVYEFDQSINELDSLFQDTKTNSLELILLLRARLRQQEEEIKEIEEEKNQIVESFRKNVKTFLAIIFGFILLLLIAIWIIRRFSIQKRLIETTKKQLIHAQNLAKIGSLTYSSKSGAVAYSDNFFETLKVPKKVVGEMLRGNRKDIYELLVSKKDQVRVRQVWNDGLNNGKSVKVEFQGITEDDSLLYLDMNTSFGNEITGDDQGISSTLQDITEKKKHELRLLEAVEKAEEAGKVKDQFLSSMSHEIRTPLNAIIGITDFMLSDKPKKDHIPKLNTLHFSSQHLLALVNDILDFSKIRSGRLKVEVSDFALEPMLQNIMLTLSFSVKEKGIKLYYLVSNDVPSFVSGDKLKVNQVLINLVGNAIKFTEEGEVKVSVDRKDDMVVFSVSDTGIGIAKDKLEKIFIGFEQENVSTARKYGGTGLGLSISRELAQLLGGGLEVESEEGVGSVFSFSIPLIEVKDRDEEETITEFLDDSNILKGLRVLCVEDNEINQMVIEQYFEKWGIKSMFADNGSEAVDLAKANEFDLVFMDIRLPDMSGYDATMQIREQVADFSTPIVALTAEIDEMTELKIKEAGMVGFLGKPFKTEELRETLLINADDSNQDLTEEEKELRIKQIEKIRKQGSKTQIEAIDESQEISVQLLLEHTQTKEALDFFVNTFSIRVEEFKIAYENAIYNKDVAELDNITHTILPHLKLLGMNNMQTLIKGYGDLDLDDSEKVQELVEKIEDYCALIKDTLSNIDSQELQSTT